MKKNGFTVVELVVSFSFIMIVVVFLFQIIVSLKNLYNNNGLKTELLNRQSIVSNLINEAVIKNNIYTISSCGEDCYRFEYIDGNYEDLQIDYTNATIQFGNYKTTFPANTKIDDISINVIKVATFDDTKNDSILKINIPIHNEKLKDQNFDVNVYYQHLSSNAFINDDF